MRRAERLPRAMRRATSRSSFQPNVRVDVQQELADGSRTKPGSVFATVHVRHASQSQDSCHVDWSHIVAIDTHDRRYTPRRASESRGSSSSSGFFGDGRTVVEPHEIHAIYEIPDDARLIKVAIGQWEWLPVAR